ncbi:GAF and ANTAR domain-containing protein [soil metagenome]
MPAREAVLTQTFVELADTLVADFDVVDLLTLLTSRCVEVIGVDAAGIMLATPDGALRVVASSSEAMRLLEVFELQSQEGPCFDCFRSGETIEHPDLELVSDRWPNFTPVALNAGFHAVYAVPMRLRGAIIGALNLFHTDAGEMRPEDASVAQALADVATIAILHHNATLEAQVVNQQLNFALNSRIAIEQAKGIIAEREKVSMESAFAALRSYARNNNERLADVARDVILGIVTVTA